MSGTESRECYNPLCEETLTCDPDIREGYCSWECAVMAREGVVARISEEEAIDHLKTDHKGESDGKYDYGVNITSEFP